MDFWIRQHFTNQVRKLCRKKDMSAVEQTILAATEEEEQKEIFYAVFTAYVKNKLVVKKEPSYFQEEFQVWLEEGASIVTRDWLHIISIYAVMLKTCGLSMMFVLDPLLQGDDAKHHLSYGYSRFLSPEASKPDEMYEKCVSMLGELLLNASTNPAAESEGESPEVLVAKLVK